MVFEVESIDRLYLNLYVPDLQRVGQVVGFLTRHLGFEIPSTAVIAPRSKAFVEAIKHFAIDHAVPLIDFGKGQRKDDVLHEYLARSDGAEQVLFIGRAQEKMTIFRTERRRNPTTGVAYPWIVPATAMVNQFYIYALDADFGPFYGRNTPWPLPPILPPAPAAHVHGDGGSAGPGVRLGPAVAQQTDDREVHR